MGGRAPARVAANRIWFAAGLLSGPVVGAFGGAVGPGRLRLLALVAGGLMVGELVVVRLLSGLRIPVLGVSWATDTWAAYVAQAMLGAVVLVAAAGGARTRS